MTAITVLSRSPSFERHVAAALAGEARLALRESLPERPHADGGADRLTIVHARSYPGELEAVLHAARGHGAIAVAADVPDLREMLSLLTHGIRAYFNSYMADVHYRHMLRRLREGERWFAPQLLGPALELARAAMDDGSERDGVLAPLTRREREIALDVAEGLRNRAIAERHGISERTVKTHVTHIYRKLEVDGRVALARALNRAPGEKSA